MEEWKIRLVNEYMELKERCKKLEAFLHKDQSWNCKEPKDLMVKQHQLMTEYLNVLKERARINEIELPECPPSP